jgi:hypothetical protein
MREWQAAGVDENPGNTGIENAFKKRRFRTAIADMQPREWRLSDLAQSAPADARIS